MKNVRFEFFVERRIYANDFAVYFAARDLQNNTLSAGRSITFDRIDEGQTMGDPPLTLSFDEAQRLAEELWRAGVRPKYAGGDSGGIAATERHLKDLQRIVFNKDGDPR